MSEHGHDWQPEVCQGEEGEGHHQQHHGGGNLEEGECATWRINIIIIVAVIMYTITVLSDGYHHHLN